MRAQSAHMIPKIENIIKNFTILLLLPVMISCSGKTTVQNEPAKTLEVPDISDVKSIEEIYFPSRFENGFGAHTSIYPDSSFPRFYEKLPEAEFISELSNNDIIKSENVVIILHLKDQSKRVFTVYPKGRTCYLEDNDRMELYTCDSLIFEEIKHNSELNRKALRPEETP